MSITKILCLTSHNLDGPDYGAAMRSRNLFQLLEKCGQVRLVLASDEKFWGEKLPPTCGGFELAGAIHFRPAPRRTPSELIRRELDARYLHTHPFQISSDDQQWLQNQIAKHDLVWIHGLLIANSAGLWRWPKSVLDIDDIPSTYFRSLMTEAKGSIEKLRYRRLVFLWERREKMLAERFDAICVCSEPDRSLLGRIKNCFTVPNGFVAPTNPPIRNVASPPRIGFIGKFNYEPNRKGLLWFVEKVWPLVLKEMPQTRLRLIGEKTDSQRWPANNIDGLGWLSDSADEMSTWSLAIVPILTGGGTRIKVAEAFSRKCPLVATSLGAYGYDVKDGRELMLADSPEVFAEKCLYILANPAQAEALAATAWQKFNAELTWDKQADNIGRIVKTVFKDRP